MENKIANFIKDLSTVAVNAEEKLNLAEIQFPDNADTFVKFSEEMVAIRGTAEQLNFKTIATIAGLGEEIAIKGAIITSRHQKRKCMTCLWDTVTTVKFMVSHPTQATGEEEKILVRRLETLLKRLGGPRSKIADTEIENLFKLKPEN